jgi:hypothetical protein
MKIGRHMQRPDDERLLLPVRIAGLALTREGSSGAFTPPRGTFPRCYESKNRLLLWDMCLLYGDMGTVVDIQRNDWCRQPSRANPQQGQHARFTSMLPYTV